MNNRGVTLMELMVVLAVIAILAISLGFSYQGWMGKYKVEKAVKDIYSDLMDARTRAMKTNHMHFATFDPPAGSIWFYSIHEDTKNILPAPPTAEDFILQTPAETLEMFPKGIEYQINWNGGFPAVISGTNTNAHIAFNKRGMISFAGLDPTKPCPLGPGTIELISTNDADFDCLCVTETRIYTGKMSAPGGRCNVK
ncbi:MAG: prepilin-type N-terminal cleavage/methylation domain-containing protein [Nitrospirae bacterium]|nr:prepilin-type N-terminal cleavage/methylation domain-containing protein [Nitrospirota bacterium]